MSKNKYKGVIGYVPPETKQPNTLDKKENEAMEKKEEVKIEVNPIDSTLVKSEVKPDVKIEPIPDVKPDVKTTETVEPTKEQIRLSALELFTSYMSDPTKGMSAFAIEHASLVPLIVRTLARGETAETIRKSIEGLNEENSIWVEQANKALLQLLDNIKTPVVGFLKEHGKAVFDAKADKGKVTFSSATGGRKEHTFSFLTEYSATKNIRTRLQFTMMEENKPKAVEQIVKP